MIEFIIGALIIMLAIEFAVGIIGCLIHAFKGD